METVTPDTAEYLWLGLTVAFGIMFALVGSMIWRYQNLRQDIRAIRQLGEEE